MWTFLPQLVVTVADEDENLVLRTLRVDFDGESFVAGVDDLTPMIRIDSNHPRG